MGAVEGTGFIPFYTEGRRGVNTEVGKNLPLSPYYRGKNLGEGRGLNRENSLGF